MQNQQLFLTVTNRDTTIFSGEVLSVSSENDSGKFDILPEHANFITLVRGMLKVELPTGEFTEVPIPDGILKVEGGIIEVFLGVKY